MSHFLSILLVDSSPILFSHLILSTKYENWKKDEEQKKEQNTSKTGKIQKRENLKYGQILKLTKNHSKTH